MPSDLRSAAGETLEFVVGPVERDEPAVEIASSTDGVVTTVANHGYSVGDHVRVEGHLQNPINGTWVIQAVDTALSFTLAGAGPTARVGAQTGTVVRVVPIDLTLATTAITFQAASTLATPPFALTKTASLNDPSSARKNLATVTIAPVDTDALVESTDLYFDVYLAEPGGRVTRLDRGIWKIGMAVPS